MRRSGTRRRPGRVRRPSSNGAAESPRSWRGIVAALGPGLVTGASDDDPSGIATYAQAGAQFRYATLWTVIVSLPLMMAVQEICDRTALTTGKSLGRLARRRFARGGRVVVGVLVCGLLAANTLNIAADLMAVGQGMSLLHAGPAPLWSALAGTALMALLVTGSFALIARVFKILCLALLTYVGVVFAAHVSWSGVLRGLVLAQFKLNAGYWALIVAILGTTISPYLFFWQTAHRVQELRAEATGDTRVRTLAARTDRSAKRKRFEARVDVFSGMLLSQVVMFAIITASAASLGSHGRKVNTAADAAHALTPIAGPAAEVLFALGFIGAGMLAVPVLAGSGSVGLAGLLDKPWGFDRSPARAPLFFALVAGGTIGGTVLSVLLASPIALLVIVAVINGIAAAPFLVVVMLIAGDRRIMGTSRNGRLATVLGWGTVAIMAGAGLVGVWQALTGS
jgi:NRAMP (natural resistance-associated macrophage protein)-like metal ion transporter